MPFTGFKPQCKYCDADTSSIWRRDGASDYICQTCFVNQEPLKSEDSNGNGLKSKINSKPYRSSARYKSVRSKVIPKGKSRRSVFKTKSVAKVEAVGSTMVTSDSIIHKGQYFQSGDIVSVVDTEDHQTYYAQCNAFMTNEYCEKFLSFTWLLPIRKLNCNEAFDPLLFYLGPNDELVRKIDCIEFVCRAPTDYFKPENSIFSTINAAQGKNFISVNMT